MPSNPDLPIAQIIFRDTQAFLTMHLISLTLQTVMATTVATRVSKRVREQERVGGRCDPSRVRTSPSSYRMSHVPLA